MSAVGDLGGGDAPISDKELKDATGPILQLPTVLIGIAIVYNLPSAPGELKLSGRMVVRYLSGQYQDVE